jgi:hypothetical protein
MIQNIIFTIVAFIANAAVTWFAIMAWFELRRMKHALGGMKHALAVTTTITMGKHVQDSFDQINEMKALFRELIEDDRYEEAKQLKEAIEQAERNAEDSLKKFKDICGDSLCDIVVTKVKAKHSEEDL